MSPNFICQNEEGDLCDRLGATKLSSEDQDDLTTTEQTNIPVRETTPEPPQQEVCQRLSTKIFWDFS